MRLVQVHGAGIFCIDEVDFPNPGPRDVVVKIAACGICGSDVHYVRNGMLRPNGAPLPLGHEAAGIVETVGAQVADIVPGMRVFINPNVGNGNVIGNGGTEGAFAEKLLVRDAVLGTSLLPIPDTLSFAQAAIVEPLAVGRHGIHRGNPTRDSKAAIFGCGPIGLGGVLWLARMGVRSVVAVDISDERLAHAMAMGAHATINPRRENLRERLFELHGQGVPVMGEVTVGTNIFYDMAGGPGLIADIISMAQHHARLVVTAVYPKPVEINFLDLLMRELEITTAGGYPTELNEVLQELPTIDHSLLDTYISHTFPFDRFTEAFEVAQQPGSAKVMIEFA
jgi:(R,R)-butanediol dehydrogenase/meso-butanediol dehydrogenase/diacetyl reductase